MLVVVLLVLLNVVLIVYVGRKLMSKLDDLAAAVTALNDSITAEIAEIAIALANANTGNDPAIQVQIDALNALKQRVDDETTAITPPPAP